MQRTTIMAPEGLLERLREQARVRGVSLAALIREALEAKADEGRPRPRFFGMVSSGYTDTSELAGEVRPEPREWRS